MLTLPRKLAGLALRQCINLGYHRHSQRVKLDGRPLRQELRRRIFWCTYVMESQASIMLGRPVGIPYYEIDAEVGLPNLLVSKYTICPVNMTFLSDPISI